MKNTKCFKIEIQCEVKRFNTALSKSTLPLFTDTFGYIKQFYKIYTLYFIFILAFDVNHQASIVSLLNSHKLDDSRRMPK